MAVETTYTALREKLAGFLDRVTDDREVVIVRRRGARDVAMIAADELAGLMETAHLLRSPKNAARLLRALAESKKRDSLPPPAQSAAASLQELRSSLGLESLPEARG
ncbi:MAG: type II toxin-antitoxin system prevent-host-death family antitoxin [Terracidiphilus sp.]